MLLRPPPHRETTFRTATVEGKPVRCWHRLLHSDTLFKLPSSHTHTHGLCPALTALEVTAWRRGPLEVPAVLHSHTGQKFRSLRLRVEKGLTCWGRLAHLLQQARRLRCGQFRQHCAAKHRRRHQLTHVSPHAHVRRGRITLTCLESPGGCVRRSPAIGTASFSLSAGKRPACCLAAAAVVC